jgi:ketosteroid isomerase-like protein
LVIASCEEDTSQKAPKDDVSEIKEHVQKWNECLAKRDLNTLSSLYADSVMLYGANVSKTKAIETKQKFFTKYPDFTQSITGDIRAQQIKDETYTVFFPKKSVYNGKASLVEGRMTFSKISDEWKITSESDDLTDKRLSEPDREFNTCLDVVIRIVTTSPLYIKKTKGLEDAVIQNGGTGFGLSLESSPEPESEDAFEFSETYDFNLHETYTDRIHVVARFSFNPEERVLYEYDIVNDAYTPIEFNKELISKMENLCK